MIERRLKYNLVDRLWHQAKEEFESTFHTLVFLSIYVKNNAVTYVTSIYKSNKLSIVVDSVY